MTLHVAVVSGSRADFGPLKPLIEALRDDVRLRLSTIVCAVSTPDEAERQVAAFTEAGLPVTASVTAPVASDDACRPAPMARQAAWALSGVAEKLNDLRPDVLLLLGDRFEIVAAALASHLQRIPIIHLSGGDETLGSLDDAMRHAISRFANLHLPTNEESARRLRTFGLPADRIVVVGSTALDSLISFSAMTREELAQSIGAELGPSIIAATYHPATRANEPPGPAFQALIAGIRDAAPTSTIVVTGSNADEGGAAIDSAAREAAATDPNLLLVPSLGTRRYWSLLHHADVVAGNSSSALIEAPVIGVPVVDVGNRQASRLRLDSCIHVSVERESIAAGIATALTRERFPEPSPYGDGRSVPRILELLASIGDPSSLLEQRPIRPVDQ